MILFGIEISADIMVIIEKNGPYRWDARDITQI